MNAEGWYRDPYGLHDDRWFSDGQPTRLVRDQGAESYDDPPPGEPPAELVPVPEQPGDSSDTKRADGAENAPQEYQIEGAPEDNEARNEFTTAADTIASQEPIDLQRLKR